jgi:hypothetical protein
VYQEQLLVSNKLRSENDDLYGCVNHILLKIQILHLICVLFIPSL